MCQWRSGDVRDIAMPLESSARGGLSIVTNSYERITNTSAAAMPSLGQVQARLSLTHDAQVGTDSSHWLLRCMHV